MKNRKVLIQNSISLFIVQGTNYLLPLITLPYVARKLDTSLFGLVMFASVVMTYFMILTDYGFNLSATQKVSENQTDRIALSDITSSVLTIKAILMVISGLLAVIFCESTNVFKDNRAVFYLTFGTVIGNAMTTVWLFQGMQQMRYITVINVLTKGFATCAIFIFINTKADVLLYPLINSAGSILGGMVSVYIAIVNLKITLRVQPVRNLANQLRDGMHVFLSSISISLYTTSVTFILGLHSGPQAVALFTTADKIIQALKGIYVPISQALFPLASKLLIVPTKTNIMKILGIGVICATGMAILSVTTFLYADDIIVLMFGKGYLEAAFFLRIMSPIPVCVVLSNIFGIQILLNIKKQKLFSKILAFAAAFGVASTLTLIFHDDAGGASIAMLLTEALVVFIMFFVVRDYFSKLATN